TAPRSSSTLIALIKWSRDCGTDRSMNHWKKNPVSTKEEDTLHHATANCTPPQPITNQPTYRA
ncbi:MAG: hypothetical protein ACREFF_15400, partial [Candidatus Udaeobacter sp.]